MPGRVRAAALTPFLGRTAAELGHRRRASSPTSSERVCAAGRDVLAAARGRRGARGRRRRRGLAARVLGQADGERRLTDLRHVGQLLHAAALDERSALTAPRRVAAPPGAEDTDDDLPRNGSAGSTPTPPRCRCVTLHASKGLQYPVVYLPFAVRHATSGRPSPCSTTTSRTGAASTSAGAEPGYSRDDRGGRGRGGRRGAAAAVRRADPGAVAGGDLVGADLQHPGVAAAPAAVRPRARRRPRARTGSRSPPTPTPRALTTAWAAAGAPVRRASRSVQRGTPSWRRRQPRAASACGRSTREIDRDWRRTSYSALAAARVQAH